MLSLVEIPEARRRSYDYPQQITGELRQRAMLALAMACEPILLVVDQQTTLDAAVQARILSLVDRLRGETGMGALVTARDIETVAQIADRITLLPIESEAGRDQAPPQAHPVHADGLSIQASEG
jgi:ABC-type dipeptide/oligopeptide/nickel transport system ATPase component